MDDLREEIAAIQEDFTVIQLALIGLHDRVSDIKLQVFHARKRLEAFMVTVAQESDGGGLKDSVE